MMMEPTKEFVRGTLLLSQEFLDDSIACLEQGRFRSSVDRAYYSIHYSAVALLSDKGIRPPRSHRGLLNVFGREVVSKGILGRKFSTMLSNALQGRMLSTYSLEAEVGPSDAESTVESAKKFLAATRSILDL